jgi:hypothetical protein
MISAQTLWVCCGETDSNFALTRPFDPDRALKRDEFRMNRHRALALRLSMIFTENRYTLFRIMR